MITKPTIGIDCRLSGVKHAGIGRYIEELVRFVVKDDSVHWVCFFQEPNQLPWLKPSSHIQIVVAPVRHYTFAEQVKMPGVFDKERLDLLHVPHFNVPLFYFGKFIVTIHDLLWHEQKGAHVTTLSPLTYALKYQAYRFIASQAMKRATAILVPAQTIKKTIQNYEPVLSEEKIYVTYEGVGERFADQPLPKALPSSKILFYTGSLYPHKNVLLIARALKKLPAYKLVISSSRDVFVEEFVDQVKKLGVKDQVQHLGRLSDDELIQWYHKSLALVQPSLSEGFGLTGVEAMAVGIPVLASDIAIFREIYKDGAIFFHPQQVESFVKAVATLEKKDRNAVIKHGREIVRNYQWETMAEQTLKLYKQVLQTR